MVNNTMTLHPGMLLKRLEPAVRPVAAGAAEKSHTPFEAQRFDQLMALVSSGAIKSERAVESGFASDAPLSNEQLDRLAAAADVAEASGAKHALMLIDGRGLVMDVASRRLTEELKAEDKATVRGVDAAVHVASDEKPALPLKPPSSIIDYSFLKPARSEIRPSLLHAAARKVERLEAGAGHIASRPAAVQGVQSEAPAPAVDSTSAASIAANASAPIAAPTAPVSAPASASALPSPPIVSTLQPVPGTGFVLNNLSNQAISSITISGTEYGVLVDNGQLSQNVAINNLRATNLERYGMYLGGVRNWTIANTVLRQGPGASEHGLRIASGDNVRIDDTLIDTSAGHKSSMWLIDVNDISIDDTEFIGGAIRIGARPNDNQGVVSATNISITDSTIRKITGGDMEAIAVWPGSNHVHLANLDITLETGQHWLSIDERNTANITWENIRVNGQLIAGYSGVKLGGMTEAQAQARGIGPGPAA